MRGFKNSKLATLAKLAKGVKETGVKMKLRVKKFCQEKQKPNLGRERWEVPATSPGFKIYEDWEPFQLNIIQPSNLNSSPRLPSYREDNVNMAPDKSDVIIWRGSRRNNTVDKLLTIGPGGDAIRSYQHSRAVDV